MVGASGGRRFLEDEGGFTLPEVLVAMTMTVTVLFALYAIFDASVRIFYSGEQELETVEEARLGLERMQREIRASYPYEDGTLLGVGSTRDKIIFRNKPDVGPPVTITYSASNGSSRFLRRNTGRIAGPLDETDGVRFAYCTSATVCSSTIVSEEQIELVRVTLNVELPGPTDTTRTLTTDVFLRNRSGGA
jgi:type II secretory pathway pseudopilin PulG